MSQMKYAEEFKQQWSSVTNFLVSEMLKMAQRGGEIPLEEIEKKLTNEKKKWRLSGQYEYLWLEKLRREQPETAEAFASALTNAALEPIQPAKRPPMLLAAIPAVVGAAAGFGIAKLLKAANVMTVVDTVGLCVIGLIGGVAVLTSKGVAAAKQDCDAYQKQLERIGTELSNVAGRADQ